MLIHLVIFSIITVLSHFNVEKKYYGVADYYNEVNLAHRKVYTCNYPEALDHFKNAFDKSQPFYHHLKNAILLSNQCGDISYTERLLVHSIKMKKLTLSTLLNEFGHVLDTAFLIHVFEKVGEIKRDKKSIQHATFLYDLLDTDQKIRQQSYYNEYNAIEMIAKRKNIDSINMEKYLDHYRLYGFLGEDNLGVWFEGKNLWNLYSILFRHFIQNKWGQLILPILEKEYKSGKIPVEIFAVMVDLDDNMNGKFCTIQHQYITKIGVKDYNTPIKVEKEAMDNLNKNRLHIGLDSFHVVLRYAKIDRFCQKGFGKEYNFLQYSIIDNLPVSLFNSEKSKQYIKNLAILPHEIKSTCMCDIFY